MPHTLLYAIFFGLITFTFASFWTTNKTLRIKALIAGILLGIFTGLMLYSMAPNTNSPKEPAFLQPHRTKHTS